MMVSRYFDEPIPVDYRTDSAWKRVPALGVRRSTGKRYEVLIDLAAGDEDADTAWVPRSRIRVADPAMACGLDSD
jgi:hypothetical protein